tara:strand:- start:503 stop:4309 length:3807 start_codon:yes stop_codon:yes gene_type:complete
MSVKITVLPDVIFRGRVKNYGGDGREIGEDFVEVKFLDQPIILDIPTQSIQGVKQEIRKRLAQIITDTIDKNLYNDIGSLIGQEGSPPQLIYLPDTFDYSSPVEKRQFLKSIISANFTVLTTSMGVGVPFGQERVWDNTAPIYTCVGNTSSYENTGKLTCAYDYLIHRYSLNKGIKKYTTSYNTTKKRGDKTTGKELIDYWITLPIQEQEDIYNEWVRRNRESFFIKDTIQSGRKTYPLNEEIGLQDLEGDLWSVKFMNIDSNYTKKDEEETLTILDLVKWCICADVRICVNDYDNQHYLSYNPLDFKHNYRNNKNKPTIVLKVEHQHAYFETDSSLIKRHVNIDNNRSVDYDELRKKEKKPNETKDLPIKYLSDGTLTIPTPPVNFKPNGASMMTPCDWTQLRDNFVEFYLSLDDEGKDYNYLPDVKNYTTNDFVLFSQWENKKVVVYTDNGNLNKVACEMLDKHRIKHDSSCGGLHSITRLTYGNLTIMNRGAYRYGGTDDTPDLSREWEEVYKLYPELKSNSGSEPTACKVANVIYNKLNKEPSLSTMNKQLRSLFFDCEIKPQNVDINSYFHNKPVISFDIKKAYTTAFETNTHKWNVYDCVSQPTKFNGTINSDWFYLAIGKSTDYPVKKGKGLTLYHGSLIRHLKGKVDIKYQIEPKRQLEPDFFTDFVKQVKTECNGVLKNLLSAKSIVNNFIGGLKRKDNLNNYHHYITKDKITIQRAITKGNTPCKIKDSEYWIIPNNWKNSHFQNGQPIRLQVIDMINEQMYLFSKWAEKMFKYPTLSIRTDACYIQTKFEDDASGAEIITGLLDSSWNESNDYKFEVEKSLNEEEYTRIRFEANREEINNPYRFMVNKWETEYIIDNKWSKEIGANLLLNLIIDKGGCLLEGQAGRGKSEMMNAIYKKCAKNRVKYALYKECLRVAKATNLYDKYEAYRKKHPVSVRMFAPTNKASNRVKGKTMNKGLGIPVVETDLDLVDEEEQRIITESYTDKIIEKFAGDGMTKDSLDIAVFEEISMCNGEMISYISYFKEKCPHTTIILCGDMEHQLPPVKEENRNFQGAYVLKEITNFTRMELRYNFRMNTVSDELWDKWSVEPHRFKPTTTRFTIRNLCKYNATRKRVIEKIQDEITNPLVIESEKYNDPRGHTQFTKIEIGTPMIASVSKIDNNIAKNDMYYVVSCSCSKIELENDEGNKLEYDKDTLLNDFQSGYCITIHKSQGETYDDEYTIWDWRKLAMDKSLQGRKLRYTAQSRSIDPENNIIYKF